jgi:hypothetical protein
MLRVTWLEGEAYLDYAPTKDTDGDDLDGRPKRP